MNIVRHLKLLIYELIVKNPELICEINWGILLQLIHGNIYEKTDNIPANPESFFGYFFIEFLGWILLLK